MSSKHLRGDTNYAWPTAEIAVMGPDGAIKIIHSKSKRDPKELEQEYREKFASPLQASKKGYLDDIIKPEDTRRIICEDLEILKTKRLENPPKKLSNIPL
jgi:propionyl-CoA carboxylase beta chain